MGCYEQSGPASPAECSDPQPRPPGKVLVAINDELRRRADALTIQRWQSMLTLVQRNGDDVPARGCQLWRERCQERRFAAAMLADDLAAPVLLAKSFDE